ncbi:hypothetical protein PVAP13_8NG199800 [Panicum virgatum]|uniref:PGG domain-containing protein n=1 Tax=Panicum virgatum TaxID=38727 RepID=A0A8T0PDK9_PANVG|nr:hypothetical protein PVAP13_8NG199800 [Panicum virgatum]
MIMDGRLLDAATTGDAVTMKHLFVHDPSVLLGTTPKGMNTCLHISSTRGHQGFCMDVLARNRSLLSAVNADGETPLLTAVTSDHTATLASFLLRWCRDLQLSEEILKQDYKGCNALHHAIRSGHSKLALELIAAEPALSKAVSEEKESPMFMAAMRNDADIVEKLLEVPNSAHVGACGWNALHAAVRNGNSAMVKKIVETRPWLAREEDRCDHNTPVHQAVYGNKIDVLRVLLEHDRSLGYVLTSDDGTPLLSCAAYQGQAGVARELLEHCPDAPYRRRNGWTCLHEAVWREKTDFVEFVLGMPQLHKLVNLRDSNGDTALHLAVQKCNPKMVKALLLHKQIDVTVINNAAVPATWNLSGDDTNAESLNWIEVSMLMLKADPRDETSIYNLLEENKEKVTKLIRNDIRSLTQTYTGNTSLVAVLIATITFAAAFTLPGGYSTDAGNEGHPIMARKLAFQAFLISDTLAMCSSLAVAFVCIIARWEDLEFLLYYRSFTKKLMWFSYMATTTAFATGLLPIVTKLLGWPILKLRFRFGQTFKILKLRFQLGWTFKSELLDMV